MSLRNMLLVVAALVMALGTAFTARSWLNSQRAPVADVPTATSERKPIGPYVLVAANDLPQGTFLQEGLLRWQLWPGEDVPANYVTRERETMASLVGAVVRRGVMGGEPIVRTNVIKPGDRGFLAAVLRPGFRAMAIPVNATTSIGGLILPGDRVDIMVTHTITVDDPVQPSTNRATETVLKDVRVLAIDQTVNDVDGKPHVGKTATLEITPKQSEMLAVISEVGSISLALRSLARDDKEFERLMTEGYDALEESMPVHTRSHTWDSEVSSLLASPKSKSNQNIVNVARGNTVQEVRF